MIVLPMIVLNLLITCRAGYTFSTLKKSGHKVYFMTETLHKFGLKWFERL